VNRPGAVLTRLAAFGRQPPQSQHPLWQAATVTRVRQETPTARTFVLEVPGWAGHDAGQHVELRLRRPDRSPAVRPYSIASAPRPGGLELTIDYQPADPPPLAYALRADAVTEVRGPAGDQLVWRPDQPEPIQLIAGGSGIVPLMAIIRAHAQASSQAPLRLLYSVPQPESVIYHAELRWRDNPADRLSVTYAYTRAVPPGACRPPGRMNARLIASATWPPALAPLAKYPAPPRSSTRSPACSPPTATTRADSKPKPSPQPGPPHPQCGKHSEPANVGCSPISGRKAARLTESAGSISRIACRGLAPARWWRSVIRSGGLRWVSVQPLGPELAQPSRFQPGREVPDDHCRPICCARHDPARLQRKPKGSRLPGSWPDTAG
jgi:ferredoxin-NADP reductase